MDIAQPQRVGLGTYFRPRDLAQFGISHRKLTGLVADGLVDSLGNGLYRISEVEATESETIAMVAVAIPSAIMCLLTALRFHEIGTQSPHVTWIALDRKARKPTRAPARVRVVRFSGAMLSYGVTRESVLGVPFRITSPARTVVDCFRYRNKIGLDIALEALEDALRSRAVTVDEIVRAAEVCRAQTVVRSYLEALQV